MEIVLFADGDWTRVIILAVVMLGSAISAVMKNRNASSAARENVRPNPEPPPRGEQPLKELERFLDELNTQRKPANRGAAPAKRVAEPRMAKKTRQSAPARKPATIVEEVPTPRHQKVTQRHLSSAIENRRKEAMHSRLESMHLHSRVSDRHLTDEPEVRVTVETVEPTEHGPLRLITGDRQDFTRAIVLAEIMGPPLALRR